MDVVDFLDYHTWADSMIIESVKQVSHSDFTEKSGDVRSIRELLEHYLISYNYLVYPSDELEARKSEISKMSQEQIMDEIITSNKKFREAVTKFDPKMELQMWQGKRVKIDKDNYLLLYLDHLTYHRGQLTHAIKMKGYKGSNTDYYDFLEKIRYSD